METETELQPDETLADSEINTETDDIATDPAQDGTQTEDQLEPSQPEDAEDEIVLTDEGGTTPKKKNKRSYSHRIQRKNAQISESNERAEKAEQELAAYKQALQTVQGTQAPQLVAPDPNDFSKFPDGAQDAAFIRENNDFIIKSNQQGFNQQIQDAQKQSAGFQNQRTQEDTLQQSKSRHYEKAAELKVPDFEEMEDNAIRLLGEDLFNVIVKDWPETSPQMAYILGKNADEASRIRRFAENGESVKCVQAIERIAAKVKVKTKKTIPADPDKKLEGGILSSKNKLGYMDRGPKGAKFH